MGRIATWVMQVRAFILLWKAMWALALTMADMTNATQKALTAEANIAALANTVAGILGQGAVSPGNNGSGAPSIYNPAYESQMDACLGSIISKLNAAGIT